VEQQLSDGRVETFLPLVRVPRRWADRWKIVSLPLFPGYLFARVPEHRWRDLLRTPGIVAVVGDGRWPIAVPDEQIEALGLALRFQLRCDPHPFLAEGQRVRVVNGPLSGLEGTLVRKKSDYRLVLAVKLIRQAVALEINAADVIAA
jgi:transcription antitermination factor NusG